MSERTNYKWLPWAVAISIAIGCFLLTEYLYSWTGIHWLTPWMSVKWAETTRAINEFSSGIPDTKPFWNARIGALVGLIILFVLGPSLWIYSEVRNQSRNTSDTEDGLKKGVSWYVGVVAVSWGLIYALPVTVIKGYVYQNTLETSAKHRSADHVKAGLNQLAYDALERYHLPREKGGGSGSFRVPDQNGELRPLKLSDLESYSEDSPHTFMKASTQGDSVFTIYGVSQQQGADPDFKNADGQKGKVQVSIEIFPSVQLEFNESNID